MGKGVLLTIFAILALALASAACAGDNDQDKDELWYVLTHCAGEVEKPLSDGTRVDCLTASQAIEYDFGDKWAECFGQALFYAVMTEREPGCVLINKPGRYLSVHLQRLQLITPPWFRIWVADTERIVLVQ